MPYRAPGLGDDRLDWILAEVRRAQSTLDSRIAEAQALPDSEPSKAKRITRLNQMKREVDSAFIDLESKVGIWADRDVSSFYRRGHQTASAQLSAGFSFTLPHREALDLISHDAYDDVATRLQQVREGFSTTADLQKLFEGLDPRQIEAIQRQGRTAVSQTLLVGTDPRVAAKEFAQSLWADGISIVDAGGRQWNPESYTRMLIRTKSANAYNAGSMNKYAEEGVLRVRVFDGVEDDPECAAANGEIWALDYAMENVIEHPNCRRAFAPEQGDGPVDRKRSPSAAVIFDRIEAGAITLAALRSFRHTGEINVSSTLARLVTEFLEFQAGVGLPLIDSFVMGALGQGFRNVDAWVEAYVDPILYAAGLIDNMPTRALLVRTSVKAEGFDTFMKRIEDSVEDGARRLPGTPPAVSQVLDTTGRLIDQSTAFLTEIYAAQRYKGSLRWVDRVATELIGTNRLGQITGETLLLVRKGEFETVREAWAEASDYIDQMAEIRRAHQRLMVSNYEEAVETAERLGQAGRAIDRILNLDDVPPTTFPAEIEELVRNYRVAEGIEIPITRNHLENLSQALTEAEWAAFHRSQQLKTLTKGRDVKALPFPASIGDDFPSEAGDYWDELRFRRDVAEVQAAISKMSNAPEYNISNFREGGVAITQMMRIDPSLVTEGLLDFRSQELFANQIRTLASPEFRALLLERQILRPDPEFSFIDIDKFGELIGEYLSELDFNGVQVTFRGEGLTNADVAILSDVIVWSKGAFIKAEFVADSYPTVFQHLLMKSGGEKSKIHVLWQNSTNWFDTHRAASPLTNVQPVHHGNMARALSNEFTNVITVDGGVNGSQIMVRASSGEWVFLKTFRGGVQGDTKGAMSQVLTSYIARQVGEIEAPPTVLWANPSGVWGVAHPGLIDATNFSDAAGPFRHDQARRLALLDMLTHEADGNTGNYMVHRYNETAFSIDSEGGFFHTDGDGWRTGAPNTQRVHEVVEAWASGDDITYLGMDPGVKLVRLTDQEVEFLTGYETRIPWRPYHREYAVPLIQDHDGDWYLIAGRMGRTVDDGDTVWDPAYFLTDSELEFVLRSREDLADDFADEIRDKLETLPQFLIDRMADEVGGTSADDIADSFGAWAAQVVSAKYEEFIDGGAFNIAGGLEEIKGRRGVDFILGEPVAYRGIDGVERFGTVINLFEDSEGTTKAHIAIGVGFQQDAGDLSRLRTGSRLDEIAIDVARPVKELPEPRYSVDLAGRLEIMDPVRQAPGHAVVWEPDDAGLLREVRRQNIQIDNKANQGINFFYQMKGARANFQLPDDVMARLTQIVQEEIDDIPFRQRPLKVVISGRPFETSDGRKAFGMFDVEERTVYVSATGLFPNVTVSDEGKLIFDSLDAVGDAADYRHFSDVVHHELGHARVIGQEINTRVELSEVILQGILDEHPDLRTVEDFARYADSALLRHGRSDLVGSDNPLAALVQFRISLVEDVINSNQVAAAKRLAQEGLPEDISPEIVHAVLRGDPEAHQELLAEIIEDPISWAANNNLEFNDVNELYRGIPWPLVYRSRLVPRSEGEWFAPHLNLWLERSLSPDAHLVPIPRNVNRAYWNEAGLNSEYLKDRGRVPFGGFTYDVVSEFEPPRGWAVAIEANEREIKNFSSLTDAEFKAVLEDYAAEHRALLDQPGWFLGGWHDTDNDLFFLDTSKVIDDEVSAAAFGFQEQQRAMFNLETFETKPLIDGYKNVDEYIDTEIPQYRRIKEELIDVLQPKTKGRSSTVDDLGRPTPLTLKVFSDERVDRFETEFARRTIVTEDGVEVLTDRRLLRGQYEGIIDRAEEIYEYVDPSIEDVDEWAAAHKFNLHRGAKVSQEKYDSLVSDFREAVRILQDNDVKLRGPHSEIDITFLDGNSMRKYAYPGQRKAPNGATVGRRMYLNQTFSKQQVSQSRVETIIHEFAHIIDPSGSAAERFASRAEQLGMDLKKILPDTIHDDIHEVWGDAFLTVMRGGAPADLDELVFEVLGPPRLPGVPIIPGRSMLTLRGEHRFYLLWNRAYRAKAVETGIPTHRIAGGSAAMSPNLDADLNFDYALWFADKIGKDAPLTQEDVLLLKKYYRQISSNYVEYAKDAKKEHLRLKKLASSKQFAQWAKDLRVGMRLSEMEADQVARTLYAFRKREFGVGYTVPTSFYNYEKAVMVMRGEMSVQDALGDTKVRSFYNNIIDHLNQIGVGDVTIDFHMIDAALRANTNSGKALAGVGGEPKIDGLAVGLRVILADIVREMWSEGYGLRVGARSPAELQEVIWAVWRHGKDQEWWGEIPLVLEKVAPKE